MLTLCDGCLAKGAKPTSCQSIPHSMRPRDPIALSSLVRRTGALDKVFEHTRELEILNRELRALLPEALAGHCAVARCDQNELALVTDTPARAARVRYMSRGILEGLREHIKPPPGKIKVSVAPVQPLAEQVPMKRQLSAEAATRLRSLADTVEDSELAASLRRLASRAGD